MEPANLDLTPDAAVPGLLIVRPDEMLFFANVTSVRDAILASAALEPRPDVVLLDLSLAQEVDVPVVEALDELHARLAAGGTELWLCHLRPDARDLLTRSGVLATIGVDHLHPRVMEGILAFALRMPETQERVAVLADLLAFIRERRARPGTSAAGMELLDALEHRLSTELANVTAPGEAEHRPGDVSRAGREAGRAHGPGAEGRAPRGRQPCGRRPRWVAQERAASGPWARQRSSPGPTLSSKRLKFSMNIAASLFACAS